MDVAGRIPRLAEALASLHEPAVAMLITHLTNIRYLTGFTGSAALLLVPADGEPVLVTDGRYEEQAPEEIASAGALVRVEVGRTGVAQRERLTAAAGGGTTLALEADHVSWADQRRYASTWFPDVQMIATSGLVEGLRAVKDAGEVARIEAACAAADAALLAVAPLLEERPTELGFAAALDEAVRRRADGISFETIVASGPNGSRPHHAPGDRVIEAGDLVVIDFGALIDGYHSDMTRTFAVGGLDALVPEQQRMLVVVVEAQAAGVAAVGPGVPTRVVDEACRAVIAEAGWADAFVHGTGHGVGLDIHEAPAVAGTADATLALGHVVTVEPGVYLPEHRRRSHRGHRRGHRNRAPRAPRVRPNPDIEVPTPWPAVSTNDLKNGMTLNLLRGPVPGRRLPTREAGQGWRLRAHHPEERPQRRGGRPHVPAAEKVDQAIIDKREMQYLYRDGDDFVFMDNETYDQLTVAAGLAGRRRQLHRRRIHRRAADVRRRDRRLGPAGRGRARRHRDRARGAG